MKEEEEKVAFSEGDPIRRNVGMTEYPQLKYGMVSFLRGGMTEYPKTRNAE